MWNKVSVAEQEDNFSSKSSIIDSKMDYDQSCRPVLIWMNLIGIPLKKLSWRSPTSDSCIKILIVMAFALACYSCSMGTALFQHSFDPEQYANGNSNFVYKFKCEN